MYEGNQRFACWLIGLLLFVVGATVVASDALSRIPNEIYRLPRVRQPSSTMVVPTAYQDDVPPIIVQDEDQYFSDLEPPADIDWPTPDQVNDQSLVNSNFDIRNPSLDVGDDFYAPSGDFANGIVIRGKGVAMKIGGYVKANLIHDFDPIDSKDQFNTTTIPIGAVPRQNTRFHARQTQLNFDARWDSPRGPVRFYIEGDFFGPNNSYRLRHAYGEVQKLLVGQTWTTFTSREALPATLDVDGAVSSVNRRPAQLRWTESIFTEQFTVAVAVENPDILIEVPEGVIVNPVTQTPDFISHLRWSPEWGQFQVAGVIRELGVQTGEDPVQTGLGWGANFTGAMLLTPGNKVYYQILFGDGIGNYRGLPDIAAVSETSLGTLDTFGWMVGWTLSWTDQLTSNFTYSESRIDNLPGQPDDALKLNTYLAVNLIWNPMDHMFVGVEYLFGTREDKDLQRGEANRVLMSFGFFLP